MLLKLLGFYCVWNFSFFFLQLAELSFSNGKALYVLSKVVLLSEEATFFTVQSCTVKAYASTSMFVLLIVSGH